MPLSSEFSEALLLNPQQKPALNALVARFRSSHQDPDSPVRAIHHQPATEGTFSEIPPEVDIRLKKALEKRGIARLYTHQAEAFSALEAGNHVVIVTPTASGK